MDHSDSEERRWICTSKYLKLTRDKSIRVVFRFKFFGGTDLTVNGEEVACNEGSYEGSSFA